MNVVDQLELIDGVFDGERFEMRGIAGHSVYGFYRAEGLQSMARLIDDNEPFNFTIDKERTIFVPVALNKQIKYELNLIAEELERMG